MFIKITVGILAAVSLILISRKIYPQKMTKVWQRALVIAALIYVGFAIVGQDYEWMKIELLGLFFYGTFARLASKKSILFLSLGWSLHVIWDILLHPNGYPGYVPQWYPSVCLGFDLIIAGYFLWYFFDKRKLRIREKNKLNSAKS